MYKIDYPKLVRWLLPVRMRQVKQLAWVMGLTSPIKTLQEVFLNNRLDNLYRLNHNGRVFSLEKVLNDKFDSESRRIYITDGLTKDRIYLYTPTEQKPVELGLIPLFNSDDYSDTGVDFIAWVPNAIQLGTQDLIKMSAEIEFYKLTAKRYRIYRV